MGYGIFGQKIRDTDIKTPPNRASVLFPDLYLSVPENQKHFFFLGPFFFTIESCFLVR